MKDQCKDPIPLEYVKNGSMKYIFRSIKFLYYLVKKSKNLKSPIFLDLDEQVRLMDHINLIPSSPWQPDLSIDMSFHREN